MALMHDADKETSPAERPHGKKSPLTTIKVKKTASHDPVRHDHYDVADANDTPKAYHAGGFGWSGENSNQPGEGPTPFVQDGGLTKDERLPKPQVMERQHNIDPKMTVKSKVMDIGAAKKVTPDSTYPYDGQGTPAEPLHEDPTGADQDSFDNPRSIRVLVWHFGFDDSQAGEGMPSTQCTLGEFFDANPEIASDPAQVKQIIDTIMAGKTYQENLGAGGYYGMKQIGKANENAMGVAVSAGNIGSASAGSLFTVKRTTEDEGDEEQDDLVEGRIVEFFRNGVPYRGRIMEVHAKQIVVSTAGRRMVVEKSVFETALPNLNGAPEPESRGPTKYGVKTPKQDHAQSSPTTPNKTMQKFVGASEAVGDQQAGPHTSGFEVDEITAPAYWAGALINGDHSGLSDEESAQVERFENDLAARGMSVVSDVEGSERFTNSYHLYNYGGDPKIRGGDVLDYVVHVRKKPAQSVAENVWGDGPHPAFAAQVRDLASYLRHTKGYLVKPKVDGQGYLFPIGSVYQQDPSLDWNDIMAHIRDYALSHNWRLDKTDEGDLIIRTPVPVALDKDSL